MRIRSSGCSEIRGRILILFLIVLWMVEDRMGCLPLLGENEKIPVEWVQDEFRGSISRSYSE